MRELDLKSDVELKNKKYVVSTIDLFGVNHNFGEGEPLLFETMIFAYDEDNEVNFEDLYCDRYSTKEEAKIGHEEVIKNIETILEGKE